MELGGYKRNMKLRQRKDSKHKEEEQWGCNTWWEQEITAREPPGPSSPSKTRHVRKNLWEPVILGSRAGAILIGKVTRGGRRISGHPSDRYLEHTCTHKTCIYISTPVQKLHKV